MTTILALDQGTTSSRAAIVRDGQISCLHSQEFPQHFPQPGWVEHDADSIWQSQLACCHAVIKQAGLKAEHIDGIGIANQRETSVCWDRQTGQAMGPAIVWQDRRTAATTDELRHQGQEALVRERSGLVIDPYFSASKMAWMLDQQADLRQRAEQGELCLGTIDSWLIYRLSGGRSFISDYSNAARTSLFNITTLEWDQELADLFRVPLAALAEPTANAGSLATCDKELFGAEIPITGCAGDQQAALFGQACFHPGMAKATYGTGGFVMVQTGATPRWQDGALTTIAWQIPGQATQYTLEGSIFDAGSAVSWLRDGMQIIDSAAAIEELAKQVPDSADCLLVPALSGLATPHWDPHARGLIIGLTRAHTRAHLARACLDGIAWQVTDALTAMNDASEPLQELRVDGGASCNDLLMQIQADYSRLPVRRPQVTESTVLGAAGLAAIGLGVTDLDKLSTAWQQAAAFSPADHDSRIQAAQARWHMAVDRCKGWAP